MKGLENSMKKQDMELVIKMLGLDKELTPTDVTKIAESIGNPMVDEKTKELLKTMLEGQYAKYGMPADKQRTSNEGGKSFQYVPGKGLVAK